MNTSHKNLLIHINYLKCIIFSCTHEYLNMVLWQTGVLL